MTGLLYVDLGLHHSPPNFLIVPGTGPYREMPTVPTQFEKIQEQATTALEKFDKIDFEALVNSITNAANSIQSLTSSPKLRSTVDQLPETTKNLNQALISVRAAVDHVDTTIDPIVASFRKSLEEVDETMNKTQEALVELSAILDSDSPMSVNLNQTLEQLTDTTRSLEQLSNYLQRNPAALIRGKYVPEKDQ